MGRPGATGTVRTPSGGRGCGRRTGCTSARTKLGTEDRGLLDYVGYPLVMVGERIFGGPADHVTVTADVEASQAAWSST